MTVLIYILNNRINHWWSAIMCDSSVKIRIQSLPFVIFRPVFFPIVPSNARHGIWKRELAIINKSECIIYTEWNIPMHLVKCVLPAPLQDQRTVRNKHHKERAFSIRV